MTNHIDAVMCFLWILTYTLVLVGTIRHKYPLISPITQLIIAPFEFAVVIKMLIAGNLGFDYISVSYLYWTIIEIAILAVMIGYGFVLKEYVVPYLLAVIAVTALMCYLVGFAGHQFFFSYFNTFVGEIVWLVHILKKDYPRKPVVLMIFVAKFLGDAISIPVYFGRASLVISLLSLLLPILDFVFVHVYFLRSAEGKNNILKQE